MEKTEKERENLQTWKDHAEREMKEKEEKMENEMNVKEEKLIELEMEMNEKEEKAERDEEGILTNLESQVQCPVCLLVPRTGKIPVCRNGHTTCDKCNG